VQPAAPAQLTVRCLKDPAVSICLYDPFVIDRDGLGFSVEAHADGLRARVGPVEAWIWDDTDLPAFLPGPTRRPSRDR
jgi:hypothetical protein